MVESASPEAENLRYRIRRDASGIFGWLRTNWREKRRFRWLAYSLGAFLLIIVASWYVLTRNLCLLYTSRCV